MNLDALRDLVPDYARDLSLNLSTLAGETALSPEQLQGCFLAAAWAVGEPRTVRAVEAAVTLGEAQKSAAKSAAAIMGMNNVYYRSLHLLHNPEYRTLPARLRMNVLGNPGAPKLDFELWSMAVSAINGCGACLDAHEGELRKHGATNIQVQAALRIASVVNAVSRVLAAETAARG